MPDSARTSRRRRRTTQAAFKPRRSHRKSRNGCAECRRRHIRCDKHHPVCFNCSTGDRACVYPAGAEPDASPGAEGPTPAPPPGSPPQQLPIRQPGSPGRPLAGEDSSFSATDLVLFHHAHTVMQQTGLGPKGSFHKVLAFGVRHRARAPYLLDQILALTSMHLAFHVEHSPELQRGSFYAGLTAESLRHHATARQTRAVAAFNAHMREDQPADVDMDAARFLFAGVLSLQSLAETLGTLRAGAVRFGDFMDHMVACFSLHRGVHATSGGPMRPFVPQSADLRAIMAVLETVEDMDWRTSPRGDECGPLLALLEESDLGAASLDACRGAAHSLQWSFDMCQSLSVHDGPHAASAFAVTAPPGYVEALRRCAPEALIILAYYGVLLHRCREYWVFGGDAGARMICAIADHVGTYWQGAMRWPLQQTGQG